MRLCAKDRRGRGKGMTKTRDRRIRLRVKRGLDLVLATVGIVVFSPLIGLIAVVILLDDGRPVLFRQTRVGRYGQPFTMLKFRTMEDGAHARALELQHRNTRHAPLFKVADDPRVTRVGRLLRRTSFDELPQLVNVLQGVMSMVGPRPALFEERADFPPALLEREALPQGITGLWQVNARRESDFNRYSQLDLDYVHNWSLRRDLWLLCQTPFVVARDAFRRQSLMAPALELEPVTIADPLDAQQACQ
jgi:lipopolysaccharide/colanic/teichoic acid biosynthesis glycosyltransferase